MAVQSIRPCRCVPPVRFCMNREDAARNHVRGETLFIDDIEPESALHGIAFRSAVPKGRIVSIAEPDLPDGYICFRHSEIPGSPALEFLEGSMPVLADETVRYLGEPILLFAGPDRATLRSLSSAVNVVYEQEPQVRDPEDARKEDLACASFNMERGDVTEAFENAYQVVGGRYHVGRSGQASPDTLCASASWNGKTLVVYSGTRYPYHVRDSVAAALDLPKRSVRVVVPDLRGAFGGTVETATLLAVHASLLAYASGMPVKMTHDGIGERGIAAQRHVFAVQYRTALDRDANLIGMDVSFSMDAGAYCLLSSLLFERCFLTACGCYQCENVHVRGDLLLTNSPPLGIARGGGEIFSFFGAELHSARVAEISQVDPLRWKKQKPSHSHRRPDPGEPKDQGNPSLCGRR